MTVCIAAACDGGRRIVSATDGLLSTEDATTDSLAGKMFWFGPWQFLYAGTPASVALVKERIEEMTVKDGTALTRGKIQGTVHRAYKSFVAHYSSFEILNAYDITLLEFKTKGRAFFGDEFHSDLAQKIYDKSKYAQDQILVTGWGLSPISVMLYEVSSGSDALHSDACFAAIGSGAPMAQSMLMLLGQARHSTLAETIFNVACAKFSAEKSAGLDVGQRTTMYVSRKYSEAEDQHKHYGDFVQEPELAILRSLWEEHIKPRIPDEAWQKIMPIAAGLSGGESSIRDIGNRIDAENRMHEARMRACEELNRVAGSRPQQTKAGQSAQPPSPESPGETDES